MANIITVEDVLVGLEQIEAHIRSVREVVSWMNPKTQLSRPVRDPKGGPIDPGPPMVDYCGPKRGGKPGRPSATGKDT